MDVKNDIVGDPFFVSFAGALVGLKAWPGVSWPGKLANLTLGFLISVFTSPAIVDYLNVTSQRSVSAIAFATGATGLVVFASLMEGVRTTPWGSVIIGWLPGQRRNKE